LKAIDELIAKYREEGRDVTALLAQREQIIADSKVSTPWYYYLNPAYTFIEGASKLASGGTVKATPGGSVVIAGEGGEDEDVVPASKRASYARGVLGSGGRLTVNINSVWPPTRQQAREILDFIEEGLGTDVARSVRGRFANG
jgi:hypothetical protein